jgi:dihydroxyacetone kinase-like predicted kinase
MNPSTSDIYNAVCKINAKTIFILPNNKNIVLSANQVQSLTDKNIVVIPTHSMPQGISALLGFDSDLSATENYEAMCEIMSTVTTMQITYAAKDSTYDNMQIKEGDYLGVIQKELITSPSLDEITTQFASKINDLGSQMVSVYYGQDVSEEKAQEVLKQLSTLAPNAEINLYFGGQAVYYYIISAE